MKLAISNIAWPPDEDVAVAEIMREYGLEGVEIAPTKIWPDPASSSRSEIQEYAAKWKKMGIAVSSMQALLFGHPELTIFESKQKRDLTLSYLKKMIRVGGLLGAEALVFGSPKNRTVGNLPEPSVEEIAAEFFDSLGKCAESYGCIFCIEPNPVAYGCDFITTSEQALDLVRKINNPGFGLHLDSAAMTMSNENIVKNMAVAGPYLRHFHISEPGLLPVGPGKVNHGLFSKILCQSTYQNWYSIEMRETKGGGNLRVIAAALRYVCETYRN
jgi:sugar phosphate isomerase/epimerase